MKLPLTRVRLGIAWLAAPVFLYFAQPEPRLILIGAVLAALGAVIRGWAAGTLKKNVELTTHGAYAHTRNPLYLGTFFIGLGIMIAGGRVSFLVAFLVFYAGIYGTTMYREARYLERVFGDAYRTYAANVPLFLPRPTPYRTGRHAPAFEFGRYVANREYQAALGIALGLLALGAKLLL
jgi:protein-S-isoprenylcysteine O-methyltransferase Ste14